MIAGARISLMQAYSYALQGLAIGLCLVILAGVDFKFPGGVISAIFIPAGAIYLWPYRADYGLSVICAMVIGLYQDLALGGPLGLFALSYAVLYALTNPAHQMMPKRKSANVAIFVLWVLGLIALTGVLSAISLGHFPNFMSLILSGVLSVVMFCGLIVIRDYFKATLSLPDMRRSRQ